MPDFTIRGNPGAIRSKAATTRSKGQLFFDTGDALSKVSVEGWTGRAADHFRDAHDLEPERWTKAGNGFLRAGAALETYAGAVENAQAVARWAADEYARGEQVTQDARTAYDADVNRARDQVANAAASGQVMTLTIIPFEDPGAAIRDNAVREFESAKSELDAAAHTCADQVRTGCQDAPEEPGWLESGLRFVGGVLEGAGEALWDLATHVALQCGQHDPRPDLAGDRRPHARGADGEVPAVARDRAGHARRAQGRPGRTSARSSARACSTGTPGPTTRPGRSATSRRTRSPPQ